MNQTMLSKVNVRPIVRLNKYILSSLFSLSNTVLKKSFVLLFALLMGCNAGLGQIAMTTTGSHSQNFNTLATSGTTNTWTNNSTILNWYSQRTGTGTTYAADAGSGTGGNLYSYGTSTNSDRALGSIGSSNAAAGSFAHGVLLRNTSGSILTDIKVSYTLEQWRNGGNTTANTITFWYKTSSSSFTSLNPNSNTGWIQVTSLSLSSPINSSTGASLNGNAAGNKVSLSNISIPSLSLANNDYIMLKWEDPDHSGTDHGLAIDDVTISWTVPATVTFNSNGGSGSMTNQTASSATNLTSNTFTRTGYTFAGWNTAANGSGTSYADGASFPFSANTTLYAQWTANNLTITFDSQGGSSVSNGSSTTGGTVSDPGNPTKSGYIFTGWFTTSSGGTAISFPYTHGQTADFTLYAQWSAASSPTLTSTTLASALSTTYGTASSGVGFIASGANLTGDITATAQSGYEVSSDNTTFSSSVSVASGATVYVRFSATQAAGSYNNATAVVLSSAGATDVNASTSASGNTVGQKTLTVTGLTAQNKVYDGLTTATATGTASLSGVVGADVVSLSGTPSFAFGTAAVGTGKPVTTLGYSLTGANAANYTLTQPSLTADITTRTLTITANDVTKFAGNTLTGGAGSTAFTSSGLQNGETIGTVTISYGNGAAAGDPIGTYSGQVTPSLATSGTFTASNYTINYVAGAILVVELPVTIAEWNFNNATASNSNINITAPIVSQGNNYGTTTLIDATSASSGYTGASGGNNAGAAARTGVLNTGSNGSAYFEFTITPNAGFQVTITDVTLGSRETPTGPKNFTLRSSSDNYTSDIFIGTLAANSTWGLKSNGTSLNELIDLAQSKTYRIFGYNGAGSPGANTANWRIDDLKIMGYVKSVPQLSTPTASPIGTTSATLGATITNDGGYAITSRGTVYGTSAAPTGNVLPEGGTSVAAFSHSRGSLIPNTLYYFRGYAINSIGTGYSPDGTFTTIHNAPVVGSGNNATSTSIDANWTAPTGGGSASFTYEIQVDDNNDFSSPTFTQSNISSATTSISASGLTPNTTYYYRVRANNAGGSSDWSGISVGYATLAVVNPTLTATALTGFGNVCLNETSSANSFTINGLALTTDDVIVSSLSGYSFSSSLAGPYTNSLSLSQAGGSYTQEVFVKFTPTSAQSYNGNIAISGGGAASGVNVAASGSGISGNVSVTTTIASLINTTTASTGGSSISTSCGTITAKGVAYGTTINPTSPLTNDGAGTANFVSTLSGLTPNTLYNYRAYATNSVGVTNYGSNLAFTTLHNAPTVGAPSGAATTGFTANWGAPVGGGNELFTYEVAISTSPTFATTLSTQTSISSSLTTYAFTGLSNGTTYYYRVRANNAGGSSDWSAISAGITTLTPWENFESGTKPSYTTGNAACSTGSWNLNDALIGISPSDRKSDSKSVRIQNNGILTMNFDVTNGISTLTIYHATYGSDASSTWRLEVSTNGGATWDAFISSDVTTSSTFLTAQTFNVDLCGTLRFRIVKRSGGSNRINIDDIVLVEKGATPTAPTAANQTFCALTNPLVSNLTTTSGSNIQWYNTASGGSALSSSATIATGTYYVTQTQGQCESSRTAVNITVNNLTYSANAVSGDLIWNGASSTNFSTTANWLTFNGTAIVAATAAPTTSTNVIIPANQTCVVNQPAIGSNTVSSKNITIENGATLSLNTGTLNIKGHLMNNGTLDTGTGTVAFIGDSTQNIGGTNSMAFYNLTVNNSHTGTYPSHVAVKLMQDAAVTGTLTLTDGILDVFNKVLTLGTTTTKATISPVLGSADSYVAAHHNLGHIGYVKQFVHSSNVGNGNAYRFPIGDDGKWTPYNLTFDTGTSIASGSFITSHVNDALVTGSANSNFVSRILRDWEVEPSAGITNPNYTIEIFHNQSPTETGGFASSGSVPFKKTSGTGQLNAPTNALGINSQSIVEVGTYTSTGNSFTWTGLTSFSNFGGTDVNQALPIELVSFQANCKEDNTISVSWTTASEHNTSHYVVEKSRDGINWNVIGQTAAAQNSSQLLNYELIDSEKANGTTYYRLTQFDNDGLYEVFDPVSVNCNGTTTNNHIMTYPNPSLDGFYVNLFTETMEGNAQLSIMDGSGRTVYNTSVNIQDGNNVFHIGELNAAPGMYYIQVSNGTTTTDIVKHSLR